MHRAVAGARAARNGSLVLTYFVAAAVMLGFTACSPSPPTDEVPKGPVPVAEAPVVPAGAVHADPKSVDLLRTKSQVGAPLQWDFVENASVETAPNEAARQETFLPFRLLPSADVAPHRVGLSIPNGGGTKRYEVAIWVKAKPEIGATIEAAGKTTDNQIAPYGLSYIDVAGATVLPQPSGVNAVEGLTVTRDGDWTKISMTIQSKGGGILLGIGLQTEGTNLFEGKPGQELVFGGINVTAK